MKIIEVCESYSSTGVIKKYQIERNENNIRIALPMFLSIGDIKNDREKFLEKLCPKTNFYIEESLKNLLNNITIDTKIRIWSSKKNADDYLLLLFLCNYLKDNCNNISVIYTSDYSDFTWSLKSMNSNEISKLLKYEHELSESEIKKLSDQWLELIGQNSELRVMENGKILNKKYSDYDNIILSCLKKLGKCRICDLVVSLMSDYVLNDVDDLIYMYLIQRLIKNNKIKIIEKGEREFVNIIKAVQ